MKLDYSNPKTFINIVGAIYQVCSPTNPTVFEKPDPDPTGAPGRLYI